VKVTVPVGDRPPGLLGVTVAVSSTGTLTVDGLGDDMSAVTLLILLMVWVTVLLLVLKLPSPL
jgi:hypothetical protein